MNEVEELSAIEDLPQDSYPSSQLCVKDIKQLVDDPAWQIYMAASSVIGSKCMLLGAIHDGGHLDDWSVLHFDINISFASTKKVWLWRPGLRAYALAITILGLVLDDPLRCIYLNRFGSVPRNSIGRKSVGLM